MSIGRRLGRSLFFLRLIPQRVHLFQRSAFQRAPLRRQRAFNVAKSAFEFGVGAAQRHLGIDGSVPGEVQVSEKR